MEDRLCICNMAIEAGAKNGIFPVDDVTEAYLKGRSQRPSRSSYEADPDAEYEQTIEHRPRRARAHRQLPAPAGEHPPCQRGQGHQDRPGGHRQLHQRPHRGHGGRLRRPEGQAHCQGRARHHHPRHAWPSTRSASCAATPTAFIDAGCIVSTPTCGPCLGGYMGILADGRALRLHHQPQLRGPHGPCGQRGLPRQPRHGRAASALTGYITDPRRRG